MAEDRVELPDEHRIPQFFCTRPLCNIQEFSNTNHRISVPITVACSRVKENRRSKCKHDYRLEFKEKKQKKQKIPLRRIGHG